MARVMVVKGARVIIIRSVYVFYLWSGTSPTEIARPSQPGNNLNRKALLTLGRMRGTARITDSRFQKSAQEDAVSGQLRAPQKTNAVRCQPCYLALACLSFL